MATKIRYTLTLTSEEEVADLAELAPIAESREPGDSDEAAVRRWLGGKIQHAEDALDETLPWGWMVSFEALP